MVQAINKKFQKENQIYKISLKLFILRLFITMNYNK